jgi:ABC-2 type transport system permease protein
MVAEFLKLKLRLLGNTFDRTPKQNVGVVASILFAIALAVACAWGLSSLAPGSEEARTAIVLGGSLVVLAFIVGYASIAFLLRWLTRHNLAIFVAYRVVPGALVLGLTAAGAIS